MPLPSDYISGTITLTNGSVDFTGTGTGWLAADFREGDIILDIAGGDGRVAVVQSITSNTAGTLSKEWDGPNLDDVAYRIRYQWDSSRVSAQTRTMIEKLGNGNLESFSSVTGPGVVVMDGPHSVIVKPEADFINGVAYDVQVDTLPDRAAYDGQSVGFSVLVSDVGDGRSAIYSKAANTVADWTDPAYVTGPEGSPSTVPGIEWRDAYDNGTFYAINDGVTFNGSSFRKRTNAAAGTSPSAATPPVTTTDWEVLASKGLNGTGTVTSLVAGDGISIDDTDPENPIISTTGAIFAKFPEASYSASRSVTPSDAGQMQAYSDTLPMTATLPTLASTNSEVYNFLNTGTGLLTIDPNGSDLIEGSSSLILSTGEAAQVWPNASKDGWRAMVSRQESEVLIYKGKQTNIPEFKLTGLDIYKSIYMQGFCSYISAAAGVQYGFRFGDNAGVMDTGANYRRNHFYALETVADPTTLNFASTNRFQMNSGSQMGNTSIANNGLNFEIWLDRFNEAELGSFRCEYQGGTIGGLIDFGSVKGRHLVASVLGSFNIFATDGNLAVIDIIVKGRKP